METLSSQRTHRGEEANIEQNKLLLQDEIESPQVLGNVTTSYKGAEPFQETPGLYVVHV